MKILVIGNICSGKSTMISKFKKYFPSHTVVKIDEIRREVGDGSFSREYLAWSTFLQSCESSEPTILEFSGAGLHKYAVREALRRNPVGSVIVFCSTAPEECKRRIMVRQWDIPYPWKEDPVNVVDAIDKEVHDEVRSGVWSDFPTVAVDPDTGTETLVNEIRSKGV